MKQLKAVGLVAIILGAVVFLLVKSGAFDRSVPSEVTGRTVTMIDVETLEVREISMVDWEKNFATDAQTGYKIDNNGKSLAIPINCASCGELIPFPAIPVDMEAEQRKDIADNYLCPKCGEKASKELSQ